MCMKLESHSWGLWFGNNFWHRSRYRVEMEKWMNCINRRNMYCLYCNLLKSIYFVNIDHKGPFDYIRRQVEPKNIGVAVTPLSYLSISGTFLLYHVYFVFIFRQLWTDQFIGRAMQNAILQVNRTTLRENNTAVKSQYPWYL